jgi:acetyl esterase/lipase
LFGILGEGIQAHGWSVAMPGYTLAPEASMTQIVGEIDSALTWLAAHGAAHGIAGKIYITGWSAGGHLTAIALSHPAVVAGLSISGVFELGTIRDTYLNDKMKFTQAEVEAFSPLRLPVVQKPLSLAFGTQELAALVEDSQALHAKRVAAHAPGMLVPVPHTNHFTILDALRSPTGIITRQILDLAA